MRNTVAVHLSSLAVPPLLCFPFHASQVLKNNNLDCRYGTTQLRHLNCDFSKVQALGSQAPPNVEKATVIALVNDVTYGGSGGNRVASIYTGIMTPFLPYS